MATGFDAILIVCAHMGLTAIGVPITKLQKKMLHSIPNLDKLVLPRAEEQTWRHVSVVRCYSFDGWCHSMGARLPGVKAPKLYMQLLGHWGRSLGGGGASSGEVAKYIFWPMNRCQSVWQCRIHTPGLSACRRTRPQLLPRGSTILAASTENCELLLLDAQHARCKIALHSTHFNTTLGCQRTFSMGAWGPF